jgi:hypothetical protein
VEGFRYNRALGNRTGYWVTLVSHVHIALAAARLAGRVYSG